MSVVGIVFISYVNGGNSCFGVIFYAGQCVMGGRLIIITVCTLLHIVSI